MTFLPYRACVQWHKTGKHGSQWFWEGLSSVGVAHDAAYVLSWITHRLSGLAERSVIFVGLICMTWNYGPALVEFNTIKLKKWKMNLFLKFDWTSSSVIKDLKVIIISWKRLKTITIIDWMLAYTFAGWLHLKWKLVGLLHIYDFIL